MNYNCLQKKIALWCNKKCLFWIIWCDYSGIEYTEHKLKIVVSFDKKEPLYCLF